MVTIGDRFYMPDWRWENLENSLARQYCDRHIRLESLGQLSLWDCEPKINNYQQPSTTKSMNLLTKITNKSNAIPIEDVYLISDCDDVYASKKTYYSQSSR